MALGRTLRWQCWVVLLAIVTYTQATPKLTCDLDYTGSCQVQISDGTHADLSHYNGANMIQVASSTLDSRPYYLSTCGDLTSLKAYCDDVNGCQEDGSNYVPITNGYDTCEYDNAEDFFTIKYKNNDNSFSGGDGIVRGLVAEFHCDANNQGYTADISERSKGSPYVYTMVVKGSFACAVSGGGGGGSGGISGGSVFLIIFFVAIVIYLIAGVAFKAGAKGARGVEMVPNLEFWKSVPGLVKDGVMFIVYSTCKRGYNSV